MRNFLIVSRYELKDIQHSLYKVLALYWQDSGNVVKQEREWEEVKILSKALLASLYNNFIEIAPYNKDLVNTSKITELKRSFSYI